MKTIQSVALAIVVAIAGSSARAQQQAAATPQRAAPDIVVKTVTLRHLSSTEAMQLLMPYVQSAGGGVYQVPGVRAVTIREVPKVFAEMEKVLAGYDRSPATVTLNFQLIAADNSSTRDPAVAGLDSLLRGVLKYSGYRLLRTTVANASEGGNVTQSLAADQDSFTLRVYVAEIRTDGSQPIIVVDGVRQRGEGSSDASVRLTVALEKDMFVTTPVGKSQVAGKELLSTGVSVPIGHTVVLGAASGGSPDRALILTVRPLLVNERR
jgi:hypothetical protein